MIALAFSAGIAYAIALGYTWKGARDDCAHCQVVGVIVMTVSALLLGSILERMLP